MLWGNIQDDHCGVLSFFFPGAPEQLKIHHNYTTIWTRIFDVKKENFAAKLMT